MEAILDLLNGVDLVCGSSQCDEGHVEGNWETPSQDIIFISDFSALWFNTQRPLTHFVTVFEKIWSILGIHANL